MKIEITLQPKQKEGRKLLDEHPVLLYGGAKGGGKSRFTRDWMLERRLKYPGTHGLIIRKTYPELFNNHIRKLFQERPYLRQFYHKGEKVLYLPNGSTITFGHLQHPDSISQYQGVEYEDIAVDEITHHPEDTFKELRSSNRTIHPTISPKMLLTGNPGGVGHQWVKRIFIDKEFLPNENPDDYAFLQAKVYDNYFFANDVEYLSKLQALPEKLRKAYLEGDWDIFEGQFFSEWRQGIHTVDFISPIPEYRKYITFDYGRTNPFALYWAYVDYDSHVWIYREYYATGKDARENAMEVLKRCALDPVNPTTGNKYESIIAPPDVFAHQGNDMTIAELIENTGLGPLVPSGGQTKGSRKAKWALMHEYLRWDDYNAPRLKFYKPLNPNAIRTIPSLIHDEKNVEDLDTTGEDHSADAIAQLLTFLHEEKTPEPKSNVEIQMEKFRKRMHTEKRILDVYAGK